MENPHDPTPPQWEKLFPRDVLGRIALALIALLFGPISGAFLFAMLFVQNRQNPDRWVRLVIVEVALAFFTFSVVGLIWAIATPRWLESALPRVAARLGIAIGIGFIPFAIVALWALFQV
ncbi:MAG: hypothetical protein HZA46_08500 [Planctomycetales bacterium]|nr:hypothetical protein [Planctomycetales bacterium]